MGDGVEGGERGRVDVLEYILVYFGREANLNERWWIHFISFYYYDEVRISGWGRKRKNKLLT